MFYVQKSKNMNDRRVKMPACYVSPKSDFRWIIR
jgi:hypothetical protein